MFFFVIDLFWFCSILWILFLTDGFTVLPARMLWLESSSTMVRFLDMEQLCVRFPGTSSTPADDEFDVDGGSAQLYSPRLVFAAPRSMTPKPASLALQRAVQQAIQQRWSDKITQVDGVWEFKSPRLHHQRMSP